jgi:hypothetical protein
MRVLEMFHFALKPGGYLFLGGSESAESVADFFIPVDKKNRIYRARPTARTMSSGTQLSGHVSRLPESIQRPPPRRQFSYAEVHQRALAQAAPPSVVLDREGNIVHMSKRAGQFLPWAMASLRATCSPWFCRNCGWSCAARCTRSSKAMPASNAAISSWPTAGSSAIVGMKVRPSATTRQRGLHAGAVRPPPERRAGRRPVRRATTWC